MTPRIYLSPPDVGTAERALVADAFDSNWVAPLGPHVDAFERELAERCGTTACAALSSGTAAVHLALLLAGVGRGDEVWCSTFTFSASVNPVCYLSGTPVLVDSDVTTWNMDPDLLEQELEAAARRGRLPKAVVAVDLYGQCADLQRIQAACDRHGVTLIEDAAEALGATAYGRPAGSFGRFGILSFNGNKIITSGGGGALLSNDTDAIARARFFATQARDPAPHYQHSEIGYNYRLSNVLAAIGRGQLSTLEQRVAKRRANFDRYVAGLGDLPGIAFMPEATYGTSTRWLTTLTIDPDAFGATREDVRLALEAQDIESRPLWKPMHLQPVFAGCRVVGGQVSEHLFDWGLCLPSGSSLTAAEQDRVVEVVRGVCRV
ncbi:MAG: pyridoxal phosphate-dependent aminotransferase [Actinobacteria bacterium]|nr:pyridoxal phosphate-dependent aminotransferase [Actinomycetota bacterium]